MPNTPKRLTPEAVTRWRRKDIWTIYETAFLLCGYEPPADMRAEKQTPDEVREAAENMGRARIAGRLRTIGPEDENGRKYMLRQRDVNEWAASAYPEFLRTAVLAAHNPHTDPLPAITLPAGTRVVPTMAIPRLIAEAFHPGADPNGTAFQAALRSHTRLLDKAARDGTVRVVSFYGEPLDLSATGFAVAGAHVTVDELCRYLAGLPVPVALRIGEPEVQEPAQEARKRERADDLAPLIEEAASGIKASGGEVTAATVYPKLRTMALSRREPFTGDEKRKLGLAWNTAAGELRYLDKESLRKRLTRR